jgi:hypothetical protein
MRLATSVLLVALVAASCGGSDAGPTTLPPLTAIPTTVAPDSPANTVARWLEAVGNTDTSLLADLVAPDGLVMLAAVENTFTEGQVDELLAGGPPPEFLEDYWSSFRESFAEFAGIPFGAVEVGAVDEFTLDEVSYVGVVIADETSRSVITRRRGDMWEIDLVASFGKEFAAQLRRMLMNLSESAAADRVREAFRNDVVPGLRVAARRDPTNSVLAAELERMTLLLELE